MRRARNMAAHCRIGSDGSVERVAEGYLEFLKIKN